ncbi:MAG TPA: SRPBCC domain-containing protein [Acidimicrobiia bacterium]
MSSMEQQTVQPLVKTVVVRVDVVTAFSAFTGELTAWWPLATHSVGEDTAEQVSMAPMIGGEIVETYHGGKSTVWGTVTEWDPPNAVAFTWHPGRGGDEATSVKVAFGPVEGGTEVTLTHAGWGYREDGRSARLGYDTGWDIVLGRFAGSLAG